MRTYRLVNGVLFLSKIADQHMPMFNEWYVIALNLGRLHIDGRNFRSRGKVQLIKYRSIGGDNIRSDENGRILTIDTRRQP